MSSDTIGFGLVAAGTAIPLAGVVALDWGPPAITLVYLTELTAVAVSYGAVSLFAQQPTDTEECREIVTLPGLGWSAVPARLTPPGLPSIRTENIRLAVPTVGVVLFGLVLLGPTLVGDTTTSQAWGPPRRAVELSAFLSTATAAVSPSVAAGMVWTAAAQLFVTYRRFVASGRYKDSSAYAILRRLIRFTLTIGGAAVASVVVVAATLLSVGPIPALATLLGVFCLLKLGLERERTRGETANNVSLIASFLVPAAVRPEKN